MRAGRFGRTLISLELVLAVAATGGGIYLMADASDAMPVQWLSGTPWLDWFWPGVALIVVNAVWPASVAVAAWRRRAIAHVGHPLVGAALLGWIAVQVAVIGPVSVMQLICAAYGLVVLVLGDANYRAWPGSGGAGVAGDATAEVHHVHSRH